MKIYKLYTQRLKVEWLKSIVAENFPGFSVYYTDGCYKLTDEKSVVIEIITDNPAAEHYFQLIALKIKGYNKQESVLITRQEVEVL